MLDIVQFGLQNSALLSALIATLCALLGLELYGRAIGGQALSCSQAVQLINQEAPLIFDLRNITHFKKARIKGAKQLNYESFIKELKSITPDTPLVIIGPTSNSGIPYKFSRTLRTQKFTRFYYIDGGLRAWEQAGLPLQS